MTAKRRGWMILSLAMAGTLAGGGLASAHHGGGHTKFVNEDKSGTPFQITFKDGRKLSGLLFVMGNTADEMAVEIGDSGTYSSVYLHTIGKIERRKAAGERHILDFTTRTGEQFAVYGHAGNVLFFKTVFGIMDVLLPDAESIAAPPEPPKTTAPVPTEKSEKAAGQPTAEKTEKTAEKSPASATASAASAKPAAKPSAKPSAKAGKESQPAFLTVTVNG